MSKPSSPSGSPSPTGAPVPTRNASSPVADQNLNLKWKRTSSPTSSAAPSPVIGPAAAPSQPPAQSAGSPGSRPASPTSRAKLALSLETFAAPPPTDRVASPKHTKDVTPSTPPAESKSMTPRLVEEIATGAERQRSQLLQDIDASGFAISVSSPTNAGTPAPPASVGTGPLPAPGGDKSRLLSRRSSQLHLNLVIARDDSAVVMQPRSAGGPLKKDAQNLADALPALPTVEQLKEMLLPRAHSVYDQKEPSSAGANSLGSKQRTPQEPLSSRGAGPRRFSKQFAVSQFPPHNFKDSEEHQRVRLKVLEELLATEITYVKEFDALVNRYFTPIVNAKLMPTHKARATVEASLHHASEILRVHTHFLEELKKVCAKSFDAGQIMKVFLEYVEFMRVYQPYVQNHYYLMNDFRSGDLPRSLKKFLELTTEEIKKSGIVKQDIAQLLIVPVQRIPRYVLLLERLEKETPEMHPDIMVIRLALEKARRIGDQVNESLKQSENSGRLFDYHQKIKGIPPVVKILSPTRIFIEEGTFTDVTDDPDHPPAAEGHPHKGSCRLVLFNDLLLITDYKYAYKTHVDMIFLAATARTTSVFEVKSGINQSKAVMILLADSPQQQASWLEHIEAANVEFLEQQNEITKRSAKVRHAAPSLSVTDKERPASRSVSQVSSSSTRRSMPSEIPKIESVNLFLRVRPFVTKEEKELGVKCLDVDDNIAVLELQEKERTVEKVGVYDDVFPDYCSQSDVFDRVGQQTLGGLFAGYNTAVFAYGNTGAGKTHTMFGDMNSGDGKGLVPRMLEALFEVIDTPNLFEQSEVRLAYLQVYNNEIQDLQADNPAETSLSVMQTGDGTVIKGMIQKRIKSAKEGIAIVVDGNKKRVTRKHNMNEMSSRSHAVLLVDLITKKADEPKSRVTLYMIDLAGSENAKDTGAVGEALTECMFINKSLTALMRVVSTLLENQNKEDKRREKVPFRDSALTHLLTDVLGGSFVCSMILNVSASPAHDQASLTAKTMQFGAGVKKLDLKAQTGKRFGPSVKDWLVGVWKSVARSSDWEESDEKESQTK